MVTVAVLCLMRQRNNVCSTAEAPAMTSHMISLEKGLTVLGVLKLLQEQNVFSQSHPEPKICFTFPNRD